MEEATARMDGIRAMVPRGRMTPGARKMRDAYAILPGAPFYQKEFGYYCLEEWKAQGCLPKDISWPQIRELFGFDPPGRHGLHGLGWCEAGFAPAFETRVLEDRGEHELVRDSAGRHVLCFKGRRNGFMPEYVDHPVKDMKSWIEKCRWRMDPATPERRRQIEEAMPGAIAAAGEGQMLVQHVVGGYMYLRSLIGPGEVLLKFYDEPDLVHDCMRAWFTLADAIVAEHQKHVTIDELFFGEDICYNHGPLISPDMMRKFLLPYYGQLLINLKRRNIDRGRHVFFHVDTDGFCDPTIPVYREINLDVMSPFEVASGCDVVRTGRQYPRLVIHGGVDKRVLAQGKRAIDAIVDRVFPAMRERGGYLPTCDHGVPPEVKFDDYLHYRKRCLEFA